MPTLTVDQILINLRTVRNSYKGRTELKIKEKAGLDGVGIGMWASDTDILVNIRRYSPILVDIWPHRYTDIVTDTTI